MCQKKLIESIAPNFKNSRNWPQEFHQLIFKTNNLMKFKFKCVEIVFTMIEELILQIKGAVLDFCPYLENSINVYPFLEKITEDTCDLKNMILETLIWAKHFVPAVFPDENFAVNSFNNIFRALKRTIWATLNQRCINQQTMWPHQPTQNQHKRREEKNENCSKKQNVLRI